MSMNVAQLAYFVVQPALAYIAGGELPGFSAPAAVQLVLGTAAVESQFRHLDQITSADDRTWGPAYGLWQVEQETLDDIFDNFLGTRSGLRRRVKDLVAPWPNRTIQLATNLAFAAVICRLVYWRSPQPLPAPDDVEAQARMWKQVYNTPLGAGHPDKYVERYRQLVAPHLAFVR